MKASQYGQFSTGSLMIVASENMTTLIKELDDIRLSMFFIGPERLWRVRRGKRTREGDKRRRYRVININLAAFPAFSL